MNELFHVMRQIAQGGLHSRQGASHQIFHVHVAIGQIVYFLGLKTLVDQTFAMS